MKHRKQPTYPTVCLHADSNKGIWTVQQGEPPTFLGEVLPAKLLAANYRVLGVPDNYDLITSVFPCLQQTDAEGTLLVGSPAICKHYQDLSTEDVLICMTSLNVHDNLVHRWHGVSGKVFNTYLLLRFFKEEHFSDVVSLIFNQHCLRKYFEFMDADSSLTAVEVISEIVDPRWFINLEKPFKLSKIESYFGLKSNRLLKALKDDKLFPKNPDRIKRPLVLLNFVNSLADSSFLKDEAKDIGNEDAKLLFMCKKALQFIVRNWLVELGMPGYFDPHKFFNNPKQIQDYKNKFGSPR